MLNFSSAKSRIADVRVELAVSSTDVSNSPNIFGLGSKGIWEMVAHGSGILTMEGWRWNTTLVLGPT